MEISRIELSERYEFRPRADDQLAAFVISGFGSPKCLQVTINGYQRHSEHLPELGLCKRQGTSVGVGQASDFGPIELLAKEMRDPRRSMSAAVVRNAFAEDRRVY